MTNINIEGQDSTGNLTPLAKATKIAANFGGVNNVALQCAGPNIFEPLWSGIRTRTRWMAYPIFEDFVNAVFDCPEDEEINPVAAAVKAKATAPRSPFLEGKPTPLAKKTGNQWRGRTEELCYHGPEAYAVLRATAETFLALLCSPADLLTDRTVQKAETEAELGRNPEIDWDKIKKYLNPASYPYLKNIKTQFGLSTLADSKILCDGIRDCFCPLELIWSYWHEEGMLVQSLNAICLRFQNKRGPHVNDPLANLRLNPLRPLSTLLWGYIQDEHNRLTVARRAYEYDHEYGLRLVGKAVSDIQTVDSRSKFLEAFHNLLYVASRFYKEADDTTVRADAFPLLNALKELHLILAQGAHNQFGDLPWASRVEMLIQKWLLARPEIREFLGGIPMVPYKENWMAHADSMKTLQGWTDVSVSQFRDLGVYGEQILLSVRYQEWINIDDPAHAHAWAIYWRPEIQSYIHSYRAVTGVDMSSELTDTRSAAARNVQPAIHQMRRLNQQRAGGNGSIGARNGNAAVYSR